MPDFSCYVMIVNNTSNTMELIGAPVATQGDYLVYPATSIAPNGGSTSFQMEQSYLYGPIGSCVFSVTDQSGNTANITFSYACTYTGTNAADAVMNGSASVSIQMIPNPLPAYGHPVNVQFTLVNG